MEFNQVAMANSEGSEVMLNRVMTKDNIGVAVLLEVNKDMFSGGKNSWAPWRNSSGTSGKAVQQWNNSFTGVVMCLCHRVSALTRGGNPPVSFQRSFLPLQA